MWIVCRDKIETASTLDAVKRCHNVEKYLYFSKTRHNKNIPFFAISSAHYDCLLSNYSVLCGKGLHMSNHLYRNLIKSLQLFFVASEKSKRADFGKLIVYHICCSLHPPGRFLRKDEETGTYYEIKYEEAIRKANQALREEKPKIEKKINAGEIVAPDSEVIVVLEYDDDCSTHCTKTVFHCVLNQIYFISHGHLLLLGI